MIMGKRYGKQGNIWFDEARISKMKKTSFVAKFKKVYPNEDLAAIYDEIKSK